MCSREDSRARHTLRTERLSRMRRRNRFVPNPTKAPSGRDSDRTAEVSGSDRAAREKGSVPHRAACLACPARASVAADKSTALQSKTRAVGVDPKARNAGHNYFKNIFTASISLKQKTLTRKNPRSQGLARPVLAPTHATFQSGAVLRRSLPGSNFLARKRRIEVKLDFRSC